MTDLLIATHDQALHAIREHVDQPDVAPVLRAVVIGVVDVHPAHPPMTRTPDPDCWSCNGSGWVDGVTEDGGGRQHCHCVCPWCLGCDEPLCTGPCETVAAVAEALGLLPAAPTPGRADP
ncbi:hypothetical protein [Micromonospora haikouensis]|uniref:hypothetical protein n=1 Tax=Micromonospora haikouensis TaxID=686309 RepID=UPI003D748DA8